MLLTQTAAGSEVEETVQDTVDTITGFNKFIQEKGPDLIAFGIRILMALLIFIICQAWQLVLPCREAFPTLPVGC